MAGKGQEIGAAYLQGVLSKITDLELKGLAEKVFANAQVQTEIGGGVAGQQEIDRQLQDLKAKQDDLTAKLQEAEEKDQQLEKWHGDLSTWGDENAEFVRLGKAAKAKGFDPAKAPAVPGNGQPPAGTVTEEKLNEVLQKEFGGVLGFALDQNTLQLRHYETFGKLLDIKPLIRHPQIREIGLQGVYELVHKDALEAKTKETREAAETAIRKDERSKVLAEHVNMPYPNPGGVVPADTSPLAAIKPTGDHALVDAAVAEYARLQQQRGA